jgi:hypothetical protein
LSNCRVIATLCGSLGVALVTLLTVLGGAVSPGYSHVSQFISELGASGAPHETMVRFAGFLPAGLLLCVFAVAAGLCLPRSRSARLGFLGLFIYALGYVAAAFFPCDAGCRPAQPSVSQLVHNLAGLAGYVATPLALCSLAIAARRWPDAGKLVVAGWLGAAVSLFGLLTLNPESGWVGVSQRAIESSALAWVLLCSRYIRDRQSGSVPD